MGLLRSCVTCLTLLLWRNGVYSTVSCPSGDTSSIVKNGKTCSQLISNANNECYNATTETSCCDSCNAVGTGISGCQYGDRVENCNVLLCSIYTDPTECCFTCRTTTATTTTTTTTTTQSSAVNSTSSPSLSSSTATTTNTPSLAGTNYTNFASQTSSSQSPSAGVIAGSVVGSLAGASLIAGVTYAGIQYFKGTLPSWQELPVKTL